MTLTAIDEPVVVLIKRLLSGTGVAEDNRGVARGFALGIVLEVAGFGRTDGGGEKLLSYAQKMSPR